AYSFKYSPRPGTPAAERDDQVTEEEKNERLAQLQKEIDRHLHTFNAQTVGQTLPVLFEKPGRHPGQTMGRSPFLQAVHVTSPAARIGDIADVTITETIGYGLLGTLAE